MLSLFPGGSVPAQPAYWDRASAFLFKKREPEHDHRKRNHDRHDPALTNYRRAALVAIRSRFRCTEPFPASAALALVFGFHAGPPGRITDATERGFGLRHPVR